MISCAAAIRRRARGRRGRASSLYIFDAKKRIARTFGEVRGLKPGQVRATGSAGSRCTAQGGFLEVQRCRIDDGKKIAGPEAGLAPGTILG